MQYICMKTHITKLMMLFVLAGTSACSSESFNPPASADNSTATQPTDPSDSNEQTGTNEPSETVGSNDPAAKDDFSTQIEANFNLVQEVKRFDLRYELDSLTEKLTDNKGKGAAEFYGTRNLRMVLPGVLYRGGANNKYLNPPRSNTNPLPTIGLKNLCEEDFSAAVYLYSENFSKAPKSMTCKNTSHQTNTLQYKQYAAAGENEKILKMVYDRIKGKLKGPIYVHCWNGWHSSGLISAMALKQFCGFTNAQADAYWVKNTDGNSSGFQTLRARIRNFKPYTKLAITRAEREAICPKK